MKATTNPQKIRDFMAEFKGGTVSVALVDAPIVAYPENPSPRNLHYMSLTIHEKIGARARMNAARAAGVTSFMVPEYTFKALDI